MSEPSVQDKLNILFVDDEENVLRSLLRAFVDEDFVVHTAPSGAKGLEMAAGIEFAVIVSDQGMPVMKGTEFLARVKDISPDTVRMVLTGYGDLGAAIEAINKGGVYQYLTKPWDNDSLVMSVKTAADRYRLVKENKYLTDLTRRQNEELQKWSAELEEYVQQQTIDLTYKNKELIESNERTSQNFQDFTVTISNLMEMRDRSAGNHSNAVRKIAEGIAEELGLPEEEKKDILAAAQLHDIGKIGLSDVVLWKGFEEFTEGEMAEYRKHPVRGQVALDSNEVFTRIGILIRSHHERFDGSGFPDNLAGDNIPLGSRILSIADRYDRLYKRDTTEAALEEIWSARETQFDPALYQPLAKVVKDLIRRADTAEMDADKELGPNDLVSGMVVMKDVRSGTGILLLSRGTVLNGQRIEAIKRHFRLDAPKNRLISVSTKA
jgi:response regulator RpfG family c-di-GMP phosphodiesterase